MGTTQEIDIKQILNGDVAEKQSKPVYYKTKTWIVSQTIISQLLSWAIVVLSIILTVLYFTSLELKPIFFILPTLLLITGGTLIWLSYRRFRVNMNALPTDDKDIATFGKSDAHLRSLFQSVTKSYYRNTWIGWFIMIHMTIAGLILYYIEDIKFLKLSDDMRYIGITLFIIAASLFVVWLATTLYNKAVRMEIETIIVDKKVEDIDLAEIEKNTKDSVNKHYWLLLKIYFFVIFGVILLTKFIMKMIRLKK